MAEVILEVGDANVVVDVATVDVAVSAITADVDVTTPQAIVRVDVDTPAVDVSVDQADIVVYTSAPEVTVDLVGLPGMPGPQGDPGPKGDPGPTGEGGIATTYVHIQSVMSPTWIVEHNMNKHPEVTCEDGAGSLIYGSVTYVDENTVLVGFAFSITGRANCT